MAKISFKPGNMLYPLPVVMVSVADSQGNSDIITVAWAGTICTNPPMVSISVRPERFSHHMLMETGEFVINLTTTSLARATDWCGVRSGRDYDKFAEMGLTPIPSAVVGAPAVEESPISIECRVRQIIPLGSHDMFLADVVNVLVDEEYIDPQTGKLDLERAEMITYCHGEYFRLGDVIGHFGWSVRKKPKKRGRVNKVKK